MIVTDVEPLSLALLRSEYNDPRIRWVFVPPSDQLTLGALRNVSIDAARGVYLANWDDDDLHDPSRLQLQMEVLSKTGATVCMLERWVVWWPERRRLFLSPRRTWEGSLLCLKSIMPRYPQLSRGEDTPVIKHLTAAHNVVLMDTPRLYVYVVHGDNTWDSGHFESIYQHATLDFSGPEYDRVLHELSRRLDIDLYPTGLAVGPLVGG